MVQKEEYVLETVLLHNHGGGVHPYCILAARYNNLGMVDGGNLRWIHHRSALQPPLLVEGVKEMRHPFIDDLNPGQPEIHEGPKASWWSKWVVRPLAAVFVSFPCWCWAKTCSAASAIWEDMSPRLDALWEFVSVPLNAAGILCLTGVCVWFYFVAKPLFLAAIFTIAAFAVYGLAFWLFVGIEKAFYSTPKDIASTHKVLREQMVNTAVANAAVDMEMAEKEAEAEAIRIWVAEETRKTKKQLIAKKLEALRAGSQPQLPPPDAIDGEIVPTF